MHIIRGVHTEKYAGSLGIIYSTLTVGSSKQHFPEAKIYKYVRLVKLVLQLYQYHISAQLICPLYILMNNYSNGAT